MTDMAPGSTLQLLLDADPWDSHIEFDKAIPVSLAGSLDLEFTDGVDPASLVGDGFDLWCIFDNTAEGAAIKNALVLASLPKLAAISAATRPE